MQLVARAAPAADMVLSIGGGAPLGPGETPGFVDSVVEEAFRRIGVTARVIELPAERSLINANAGIEDGDALRAGGIEERFANLTPVPEVILNLEIHGYTLDPDVQIASLDDLAGRSVGIPTGFKLIESEMGDHADLIMVRDRRRLFGLLANRRVEFAMYERWNGNWWAKRIGLDCRSLPMPIPRTPSYIYLHKRHAALVPKVAAALRDMKQDGTYAKIFLKTLAPLDTLRS